MQFKAGMDVNDYIKVEEKLRNREDKLQKRRKDYNRYLRKNS